MAAVSVISPDLRKHWRLSGSQVVVAIALMIGIGLVFYSYVALNEPPPPSRWPAYFAWSPETQSLAQPSAGPGAYQSFVLKSWLDEQVPFVPLLSIPYLSFLLLAPIVVPLLNLRISFKRFLTVAIALIISQLVLDVAYLLFQTNVIRDVQAGDGVGGFLVKQVWGKDQPFNGFPSGHCTWTTIAICSLMRLRKAMPKTAWIMSGWLLLIYPATVMLRQHYLIDVYTGIFVGFAVYWAVMFVVERPRLVPRNDDFAQAQG